MTSQRSHAEVLTSLVEHYDGISAGNRRPDLVASILRDVEKGCVAIEKDEAVKWPHHYSADLPLDGRVIVDLIGCAWIHHEQ